MRERKAAGHTAAFLLTFSAEQYILYVRKIVWLGRGPGKERMMTAQEIRERLEKAEAQVSRKEATLAKHIKKVEKTKAAITERGWDIEAGAYQMYGTPEHNDCYWAFCDYDDARESVRRTEWAVKEKRQVVENWKAKLEAALEREADAEAMPDLLKQYKDNLVTAFDKSDERRRAFLRKEYERLGGYKPFCKEHGYRAYEWTFRTYPEQDHKENTRAADALVRNLWERVKEICGTAEEIHLHLAQGNEWEGVVINGRVVGRDGTAWVESIVAGGYNIQRLHIRTLVHGK